MAETVRALIVYESMFGNTEKIAVAIRDGLRQAIPTELVPAHRAPTVVPDEIRLLVVGGPTHAFSMSRVSTRAQAPNQGDVVMPVEVGIREWLGALAVRTRRTAAATFDTRITKVRRLPGSAARSAAKLLRRRDYDLVAAPESFYLDETVGPIDDAEIQRARQWGERLGKQFAGTARPVRRLWVGRAT